MDAFVRQMQSFLSFCQDTYPRVLSRCQQLLSDPASLSEAVRYKLAEFAQCERSQHHQNHVADSTVKLTTLRLLQQQMQSNHPHALIATLQSKAGAARELERQAMRAEAEWKIAVSEENEPGSIYSSEFLRARTAQARQALDDVRKAQRDAIRSVEETTSQIYLLAKQLPELTITHHRVHSRIDILSLVLPLLTRPL